MTATNTYQLNVTCTSSTCHSNLFTKDSEGYHCAMCGHLLEQGDQAITESQFGQQIDTDNMTVEDLF